MAQQDILDYIRKTPHNSNVNVVKGMLNADGDGEGSSDLSTATLTYTNNSNNFIPFYGCIALYDELAEVSFSNFHETFYPGSRSHEFIMYKDHALLQVDLTGHTIAISGDIEDIGDGFYVITGNCTITIS